MAYDGTLPARSLADAVAAYEAGDFAVALPAFRALADGGAADAAAAGFYLGRMAARGEGMRRDPREAVRRYRAAAEAGDFRAQHNLSLAYESGDGVAPDEAEAVAWLRRAAEQGSGRSRVLLGYRLARGDGVARDPEQAVACFRAAAAQGEAEAMVGLGDACRAGVGIARDPAAALSWYLAAAVRGHAGAQYAVGDLHAEGLPTEGEAVKRDHVEAAVWFRKAAEQGNPYAQAAMGHACLNGRGVRQDLGAALAWFRRAADLGLAPAQHSLGFMLLVGQGIAQDAVAAAAWMRLAADQGHPRAQQMLGMMCRDGLGAPADPVEAWRWFDLAAASATRFGEAELAEGAAESRAAVEAALSTGQLADARARVREWRPKSRDQSINRAALATARAWELADRALLAWRHRVPDDPAPTPFGDGAIFRQDPALARQKVAEARALAPTDPQAALDRLDEALRLDYRAALDEEDILLERVKAMHGARSDDGRDEPVRALMLYNIGAQLSELRRWPEATAVYRAAGDLDPLFAWPFNNLAWMLSTAQDVRAHDGPMAVTYAVRACDIAGWSYWPFLGTLAAAFARSGDFGRAAKWQALSLALAPDHEKEEASAMLESFEAGQAHVDHRRTPAAGDPPATEEELAKIDVEALLEEARGLIEGRRVTVQ